MKLNIRELSIGNKVKVDISNDAGIYTITSIPGWDHVPCVLSPMVTINRCPSENVAIERIKPVKLTVALLTEQYGFTKAEDRYGGYASPMNTNGQGIRLILAKGNKWFFNLNMYSSVVLRGLHHLQNLYMNLYNIELKSIEGLDF